MSEIQWTDDMLDRMRSLTDPLADAVVDEIFADGEVTAVNNLMRDLVRNDQVPSTQLPAVVEDYLVRSAVLPDWADAARIRSAEAFFARHGLLISTSLFFASLPRCYACANGVQVLHQTARLATDTRRRIAETGQMVLDTMAEGGLAPGGKGIRATQKVRLMHAAVRHLIRAGGHWNPAWGEPVNQEDLGGTLMAFGWVPLDCLDRMKIPYIRAEAEDYIHAWRTVGFLLGVRDEMLPRSLDEAAALMGRIGDRQFAPSEAGREMTSALIEMIEETMPGNLFDGLPATMIRFCNGDAIADLLGTPKSDWTSKLIGPVNKLFGLIEGEEDHSSICAKAAEVFGREFNQAMSWVARGGARAPFAIPDTLRAHWGLNQ
jgi:hypothetical protein